MKKNNLPFIKNKILKRVISSALACSMILSSTPLAEFSDVPEWLKANLVVASATYTDIPDSNDVHSCTFTCLQDLIVFSKSYNEDSNFAATYSTAKLNFEKIGEGMYLANIADFKSIGTCDNPFKGEIFSGTQLEQSQYLLLDKPLFDYIDVSATMSEGGTFGNNVLFVRPDNSHTDTPVFANHVVKRTETDSANWTICTEKFRDSEVNDNDNIFGGFIGEIEENITINLTIKNNVTVDANSTIGISTENGDAGFICKSIGNSSTLNVNLETNSFFSVTSTNGNAGGLVGSMGNSATLTVTNTSTGDITLGSVTASGNAGGIVGSIGEGSSVVLNLNGKTFKSGTVSADDSAGGIVGSIGDGSSVSITNSGTSNNEFNCNNVSGKIAGGLIGTSTNGTVSFGEKTSIKGVVNGTEAAGGIFGDYTYNKSDTTINLNNYPINCTVTGAVAGGVYGYFRNNKTEKSELTFTNASENNIIKPKLSSTGHAGGIIGAYSCTNLNQKLKFNNITINPTASSGTFGGFVGVINSSSYINFENATVKMVSVNDSVNFGGFVGNMGNNGSFLDIGNVKVEKNNNSVLEYKGGGLVYSSDSGVIRLSGVTDMSNAEPKSGAQLVYTRGQTFIYADGNGSDSNWTFKRCSTAVDVDDIGNWGEVVRFNQTDFKKTDVITENFGENEENTVTIKSAATTMGNKVDFAKTALNIQLNTRNIGALQFQSGSSASLLGGNLSITDDINLSGMGLTGFTRDDGENGAFSGTLSSDNNKTLTLSIGEAYGMRNDVAITTNSFKNSKGSGRIYNHSHTGLFAKTKGTATFNNITISGNIFIQPAANNFYVGGLSAVHESGDITIRNVTASENINFGDGLTANDKSEAVFIGGLIGYVNDDGNNVSISDCTNSVVIDANSTLDSVRIGLMIGVADENTGMTITGSTIGGTINASGSYAKIGGVVGESKGLKSSEVEKCNSIEFNDNTVTATINSSLNADSDKAVGGLLGYNWANTNVTFKNPATDKYGICIDGAKISATGTEQNYGALLARASGKWTIDTKGIKFKDFKFYGTDENTAANVNSFAMLVNQGRSNKDDCIYIELKAEDNYFLDDKTNIKINNNAIYDEFVAYNYSLKTVGADVKEEDSTKNTDVCSNGQPIISIPAKLSDNSDKIYMDGTKCNTYQNRADVNECKLRKPNPNIRYYYNLNKYSKASGEIGSAEELLMWSVGQYAGANIETYFRETDASANITVNANSDFDLTGYSYYPVDIASVDVNVSNSENPPSIKFTFNNKGLENSEKLSSVGSDSLERTSKANNKSQHYLMHCGLYRNVTGNIKVENVSLNGTVGTVETVGIKKTVDGVETVVPIGSGSGAIVCGIVKGTELDSNRQEKDIKNNVNLKNITLDGIKITDIDTIPESADGYAPLLINEIASYADITVDGVETSDSYSNFEIAATSLMGKIGKNDATKINLKFKNIKLDGRKESISDLDTKFLRSYHTKKSIFKKAILLESLSYSDINSKGVYDFTYADVWNGNTFENNATYGWELYDENDTDPTGITLEWKDKQQNMYSGDKIKYVNLEDEDSTKYFYLNGENSINNKFLKYVYTPYNKNNKTHELKVNHHSADLNVGCGTYEDPYIISTKQQLDTISKALSNITAAEKATLFDENFKINYPKSSKGATDLCSESSLQHDEYLYNLTDERFKCTGKDDIEIDTIRNHLAQAYYVIEPTSDDYTINLGDWQGIGSNIPFTGVIVGKQNENTGIYPVLVNGANNGTGFVVNSNGCVLKDLEIKLGCDTGFSRTSELDTVFTNSSNEAYGAVINQIHGGDNIIDNVVVNYDGHTYYAQKSLTDATPIHFYNTPVGGYVGVIVNGGLFFRNMPENVPGLPGDKKYSSKLKNKISDANYYYQNPFIGRVINGFAVYEDDSLNFGGNNTRNGSLDNGTKNYIITTLKRGETGKLNFDSSSDNTINIPNAQALFVLSAITQSGAGLKSYGNADYRVHIADYTNVGSVSSDLTDFNSAKKDDTGTDKVSRLIKKYVADSSQKSMYNILANTNTYYNFKLSGTGNYDLSGTGFRGINGLFNNNNIKVRSFNGNGKTITLSMSLRTNGRVTDEKNSIYPDNYHLASSDINHGFGLFNHVDFVSSNKTESDFTATYMTGNSYKNSSFYNLTLAGSVFYDERKRYYDRDASGADAEVSVGGLIGRVDIAKDKWFELININTADDFNVSGVTNVGGLVGKINKTHSSETSDYQCNLYCYNCGAEGIKLTGYRSVGGILGLKPNSGTIIINGKSSTIINGESVTSQTEFQIKRIGADIINSNKIYDTNLIASGKYYEVCYGGLIGLIGVKPNTIVSSNQNSKATNKLVVTNYKIEGKEYIDEDKSVKGRIGSNTYYNEKGTADNIGAYYYLVVGAICGSWFTNSPNSKVENFTYEDIELVGGECGGIAGSAGRITGGTGSSLTVKNFRSNNVTMFVDQQAGGVLGMLRETFTATFDDVKINNLKIHRKANGWGANFGAVLGMVRNKGTFRMKNIEVNGFELVLGKVVKDHMRVGALIGGLWEGETKTECKGYNILINDVNIAFSEDTRVNNKDCLDKEICKTIGGIKQLQKSDYIQIVGCQISNFNAYKFTGDTFNSSKLSKNNAGKPIFAENEENPYLTKYKIETEYPVMPAKLVEKVKDAEYNYVPIKIDNGKYMNGTTEYFEAKDSYIIYADAGLSCIGENANKFVPVTKTVDGVEKTVDEIRYPEILKTLVENKTDNTASGGIKVTHDMVDDFKDPVLNLNPINSLMSTTDEDEFVVDDNGEIVLEEVLDEDGNPTGTKREKTRKKQIPASGFFFLTGDGVAPKSLRDEFFNSEELYVNAMNAKNPEYETDKNKPETFNIKDWFRTETDDKGNITYSGKYASKFSDLRTELSGYDGIDNFPVIIVDSQNYATEMIEYYIKLITNYTDFKFDSFEDFKYDFKYVNESTNPSEEDLNYSMTRKIGTRAAYTFSVTQYKYDKSTKSWSKGKEPTLKAKLDGNKFAGFRIDSNDVDTTNDSFNLIDVAFYNPLDDSKTLTENRKVAYHLYIPVFVKKILKYDVKVALNEGVDYNFNNYKDKYQSPLACNPGSDVTAIISFDYTKNPEVKKDQKRTLKDWNEAIQTGDNFRASLDKVITFNMNKNLPDGTQFILVDRADDGKAYYLEHLQSLLSLVPGETKIYKSADETIKYVDSAEKLKEYSIKFSAFKDSKGDSGTIKLYELLQKQVLQGNAQIKITDSTNKASDTLYVMCNEANGTMYAPKVKIENNNIVKDENGNIVYEKKENDEIEWTWYKVYEPGTDDIKVVDGNKETIVMPKTYKIELKEVANKKFKMQEDYYLTIITPDNAEGDYNFIISAEINSESSDSITTKYETHQSVNLLIADFYIHNSTLTATNDNAGVMDSRHPTLTIEIVDNVNINENYKDSFDIYTYSASTKIKSKIYQEATLYLTQYIRNSENTDTISGIYGNPSYSYTYKYEAIDKSIEIDDYSYSSPLRKNMASLRLKNNTDIRDAIKDGVKITCTITLTYNEEAFEYQFPKRPTELSTDGTSATSMTCIASNTSSMLSSSTQKASVNKSTRFYRKDDTTVKLTYNVPKSSSNDDMGSYNQLGINEKYMKTSDEVKGAVFYDIEKLTKETKEKNEYLKVTMTLQRKTDDEDNYEETVSIKDYLNVNHYDYDLSEQIINDDIKCLPMESVEKNLRFLESYYDGNNKVFIFEITKHDRKIPDSYMLSTYFYVKTGDDFEEMNGIYSNYKVTLEAVLLSKDNENQYVEDNTSRKSDYLIYTNAKLCTDIVRASKPSQSQPSSD